jgi:hypothetical protein
MIAFFPNTGWPAGAFNDTDDVFATEKGLADSSPIRKTNVDVIEHAKATGVTSYIVVPTHVCKYYLMLNALFWNSALSRKHTDDNVDGRGTGPWNQLSVVFPVYVSTAISQRSVFKFTEDTVRRISRSFHTISLILFTEGLRCSHL